MPYSLAIFDLDGTLADSFPWFLRNVNGVADRFGFRRIADGDVESLRHAGPREILRRLEVPLWKLPGIARHIRRMKTADLDGIPLFPGTTAMLQGLRDGGLTLALVSSDDESNARQQLGEAAALFAHFDCGASLFGKAAKFRRVVKRAGFARAAVMWGYAAPNALRALGPEFAFDRMEDIARRLVAGRSAA